MPNSRNNDDLFTDQYDVDEDGWESGMTKDDLGRAIQVLEACHENLTIPQAASIFQVSTNLVDQVVNAHPWLYEDAGVICADGM